MRNFPSAPGPLKRRARYPANHDWSLTVGKTSNDAFRGPQCQGMSLRALSRDISLVAALTSLSSSRRSLLGFGAALALTLGAMQGASAESADCARLRQQIDTVTRASQVTQYAAAADKQRGEIDRMAGYARSIGCENHKFFIFGSDPPPQCGTISAQLERMRANLTDLQARSGGGAGGRGELMARYRSECTNVADNGGAPRPPNLIEGLFGQNTGGDPTLAPLNPDGTPQEKVLSTVDTGAQAGGKAVCVKTCDGSFFPVSYSASSGRLASLEDLCRAQCPNAEVTLFTYPASGDIEQAVSTTGTRYVDSPNALKYRTSFDPNCSCRRKGESWSDALSAAEAKLGREPNGDIIVTAQKSDEMARPKLDPKAKPTPTPALTTLKPAPGTDINGVDTNLSQQAANVGHDTSGIAATATQGGAHVGAAEGKWAEVTGPDGVKRRVRIIDPTL